MDYSKVMIQKHFKNNVDELKGLINDEIWSALSDEWMPFSPQLGPDMLLAVSGGMDSMCMAHLYLKTYGPHSFAIAHCNFNLRGEESDADEALVKDWAAQWGITVHSESFDTKSYARDHGVSIEMAARELRYSWFADLCIRNGYRYVAVAHHARDNAETMILNIARGTGLKGLAGMNAVSTIPYADNSLPVRLIRPMLDITVKQIEGYVFHNSVPFRNDSTNASVEYKRNRIRHEVLPVLETLNPSVISAMNREMAYISEACEIVGDWCRTLEGKIVERCGTEGRIIKISIPKLMAVKQWRYLLYHILEPYGFTSPVLASIEALLKSGRTFSGKRFISGTHVLVTGRDEMVIEKMSESVSEQLEVMVDGAGLYNIGDTVFSVELCPWMEGMSLKQPDGVMIFDASILRFPFLCRSWKQGDWLIPLGMKGKKKLSDIFTDLKWDFRAKTAAVVVVNDGQEGQHVAALLGARMDERYKVTDNTEMIIRITLK